MSRKWIGLLTALLTVGAVMLTGGVFGSGIQKHCRAEAMVETAEDRMAQLEPAEIRKQRNLARWYNLALGQDRALEELQEVYGSIINLGDGLLGILEIPRLESRIPIYHHADPGDGAGHVSASPFPIGGLDNHTVLIVPEMLSVLEPGDIFWVHILDEALCYQVRSQKLVQQGRPEGLGRREGEDLCTLAAAEKGGHTTLIYGIRIQDAGYEDARSSDPSLEQIIRKIAFTVIICLCIPAATGMLGHSIRLLGKYCGTLPKKVSKNA